MNVHIVLTELRAAAAGAPAFSGREGISDVESAWLGKAYAAVALCDATEASTVQLASNLIGLPGLQQQYLNQIKATLSRCIAVLELQIKSLPTSTQQAYGPGATYDFFRDLAALIRSTKKELLIADPYLDSEIFDVYMHECPDGVSVHLLCGKYAANLKSAAGKFANQRKLQVELRQSSQFHDRVVFIDSAVAWVLGQSIKDAAKRATYLAPLSPEVSALKREAYNAIWVSASVV